MCVTGKDNNKLSDSMETSVSVKNTIQDTDTVNKKRQAPVSPEPCGSEDRADDPFIQEPTENPFKEVFIKPCVKKKKRSITISDDCPNFKEFQHLFENSSQAVSYEQMCEYLQEVKGKENPEFFIRQYTSNVDKFLLPLISIVRTAKLNTLKSPIKRIVRKIQIRCQNSEKVEEGDERFSFSPSQEYAIDCSED
ncbi:hypothetical protein Trydic_g1700 [Trypoxylus dichotomus]